ncbi:MAG: sulfotransferase family protein [Bacteroidetes bacterium]|nr:sulfotransferase family protein [Bacteroidota bacterium]
MKINRINLWSGPRNVSTALMYSFSQRPDTTVLDEPLYAHYLKQTGIDHPGKEETLAKYENDGQKVVDEILWGEYSKKIVFFKHMAKHLVGLSTDFILQLNNVFLIREPKDVIASFDKVTEPTAQEISLKNQWELFTKLQEHGRHPQVIDSKELLKEPGKVLKELCGYLEIKFYDEMLHWEPGPRPEDGTWAKYWYHNVHQSTGFTPFTPKNEPLRKELKPLLKECEFYYQKLYAHCIKV